ncbi:MAG TPA: hypothetical protein VG936_02325 [Lacunisphaera sp.]|nr:hypothetical protein [Lacunisphaera sp.]
MSFGNPEFLEANRGAAVQAKSADELIAENNELKAVLAAHAARTGPGILAVTGPHIEVTASAIEDELKGYAKIGIGDPGSDPAALAVRAELATQRGLFFRDNIAPIIAKVGGREFAKRLVAAIPVLAKNAEVLASNSLGTLVGNLVAQQSLSLLKYEFPALGFISRDFSNESVKYGQTIDTRTKSAVTVQEYDPASGGYPPTNATTTDVAVTINKHVYAGISFNANELASTNRDLFGEQAGGCAYALGEYLVGLIYALITPTAFSLTAQKTTQAKSGFARVTVQAMGEAMTARKIGKRDRALLLNSAYYNQLGQDSSIVTRDSYQGGQLVTDNVLPMVAGFLPIEAPSLPTDNNLTGFGLTPEALVLATRLPVDYTTVLPGANYGSVSQVTDPSTGISLMLVQFVDHRAGSSNYRVALMGGVAVGDTVRGQLLVSA